MIALGDVLAGAMMSWVDDIRDEALVEEPGPHTAERLASVLLLQATLGSSETVNIADEVL